MVAQNWIKALNIRLAETQNIGAKVGYGALIISVGAVAAVGYLIVGTLYCAAFLFGRIWTAKFDLLATAVKPVEPDGYAHGPHGYGLYRKGEYLGECPYDN